jgi:hypothetical protein
MNQASYDLARLRHNELIRRVEHTNTYTLTADGQLFAIFYSKLYDRVLYPLMPQASPSPPPIEVRRAVRTIERHIDRTVTAAGLTRAA